MMNFIRTQAGTCLLALLLSHVFMPVQANEAAEAFGDAVGSAIGNALAAMKSDKVRVEKFNARYFELKKALESCNGCPREQQLRTEFNLMRFSVELEVALKSKVMMGGRSANDQEKIFEMYDRVVGKRGEGLEPQCIRKFDDWGECLGSKITPVYFDYVGTQKKIHDAIAKCDIAYLVYKSCRDDEGLILSEEQQRLLRKQTRSEGSADLIIPTYEKMDSETLRDLVKLVKHKVTAVFLVTRFGEPVIKATLEKYKDDKNRDDLVAIRKELTVIAESILQERIKNSAIYSYVLPAMPGTIQAISYQHKQTIIERYNDDPFLSYLTRMDEDAYSQQVMGLLWRQRAENPQAKQWLDSLQGKSILVCHYPRKVAHYWHPYSPDTVHETVADYVLWEAAEKCPEKPGRFAVFRDDNDVRMYFAQSKRTVFKRQDEPQWKEFEGGWLNMVSSVPYMYGIPLLTNDLEAVNNNLAELGYEKGTNDCQAVYGRRGFTGIRYKCMMLVRAPAESIRVLGVEKDGYVWSLKYMDLKYEKNTMETRKWLETVFGKPDSDRSTGDDLRLTYKVPRGKPRYSVTAILADVPMAYASFYGNRTLMIQISIFNLRNLQEVKDQAKVLSGKALMKEKELVSSRQVQPDRAVQAVVTPAVPAQSKKPVSSSRNPVASRKPEPEASANKKMKQPGQNKTATPVKSSPTGAGHQPTKQIKQKDTRPGQQVYLGDWEGGVRCRSGKIGIKLKLLDDMTAALRVSPVQGGESFKPTVLDYKIKEVHNNRKKWKLKLTPSVNDETDKRWKSFKLILSGKKNTQKAGGVAKGLKGCRKIKISRN